MSAKPRTFKKGQYLFRESEEATSLFIIQTGSIAIRKNKPGGQVELAKCHSSEVVGEMAFFDKQPRSASAVTLTDVQALEIGYPALKEIYQKVPSYFRAFMVCLVDRLRKADETIRRLEKNIQPATQDAESATIEEPAPGGDVTEVIAQLAAEASNPDSKLSELEKQFNEISDDEKKN